MSAKIGAFVLSHTATEVNRAWLVNDQTVWPNAENSRRTLCDWTVVWSPVCLRTASTLLAAATGSPSEAQIDSAAALSDSVIAAVMASVTLGGFSSRNAAMISGTLIVDQAGPLRQSPNKIGACAPPTALSATPTTACSFVCYRAKSTLSAGGAVLRVSRCVPTTTPASSVIAPSS